MRPHGYFSRDNLQASNESALNAARAAAAGFDSDKQVQDVMVPLSRTKIAPRLKASVTRVESAGYAVTRSDSRRLRPKAVKGLPSKTSGSKSEDPATNLSLNIQDVVETVGAAVQRGAASTSEISTVPSKYFDTSDRATIEKVLRDAAVPADNLSAHVDAAQATLQETAKSHTTSTVSETTRQANAGPTGFGTEPLTLEASTPNVLGTQSRRMLVKYSIGIAIVSLLACIVTLFSGRDVSQLSLALVVLALACMVIAYLTTMGFGSVQLRYGSNDSSDQSK